MDAGIRTSETSSDTTVCLRWLAVALVVLWTVVFTACSSDSADADSDAAPDSGQHFGGRDLGSGADARGPSDVGPAGNDACSDSGCADAASEECGAEDADECLDEHSVRSCVDGSWTAAPCGPDERCDEGRCGPDSCEPGERRCADETTIGVCDDAGNRWNLAECGGSLSCDPETVTCFCDEPVQILFLLDASGSMALNTVDGVTRWLHARNAITSVMEAFPDMRYGLKTFPDEPVDCTEPECEQAGGCLERFTDELAVVPGSMPEAVTDALRDRDLSAGDGLLRFVLTPLVNAFRDLETADLGEFRAGSDSPRVVVLISDGEDTCHAPHAPEIVPGELARSVAAIRDEWGIQTHVVGFGYEEGSRQLSAIAQAGGTGQAVPTMVTNGDELAESIAALAAALDQKRCETEDDAALPPDCERAGLADRDGDGWCDDLDCDDGHPDVWPGAVETLSDIDDDCDGEADEAEGHIPPIPEADGCGGIDFLFVIDNSESMSDEQDELAASVPGFLEAIRAAAPTGDYHIMVIDSDGSRPVLSDGPECDDMLGAGRTRSAFRASCFPGPLRWVSGWVDDIDATFACMAHVGTGGSGAERAMEAMGLAVNRPLVSPGGCNEGFLREDAILVVTFITDEPAQLDAGVPESWRSTLVGAKGGRDDGIYVVGVFAGGGDAPGSCTAFPGSPRLAHFVDLWGDHGHCCPVSAESYSGCLTAAVEGIATTCVEYSTE